MTFDDLRAFALDFADVKESTSYGTHALKLKDKLLVRLREDGRSIAMLASDTDIQALPQVDAEIFSVPQHYVGYGMLVVDLQKVRTDELKALFVEAIRQAGIRQRKKSNMRKTR